MKPSVTSTWLIYTDSMFEKIIGWDRTIYNVKRKIKSGNKTTYILIDMYGDESKAIIDGISVTTIEGANEELKSVFKITKTEKMNEACDCSAGKNY